MWLCESVLPAHTVLVQINTFKEYVELYLKGQEGAGEEEGPRKVVHEVVNRRWEVCVAPSDNKFQQASFVNSIATSKVSVLLLCSA